MDACVYNVANERSFDGGGTNHCVCGETVDEGGAKKRKIDTKRSNDEIFSHSLVGVNSGG
eukprot:326459-Hanusia_phi.AAC.3